MVIKSKKEISQEIGVSRQMLHAVVTGKLNCGYNTAKQFDRVLGGGVEVWVYPNHVARRMGLLDKYRRIKR